MHARRLACVALVLALGCDGSAPSDAGITDVDASERDSGTSPRDSGSDRDSGTAGDSGAGADAGSPRDGGSDAGSGEGGAAYRGRVLFEEPFADGNVGSRGWYDGRGDGVVTSENAPGGTGGAFACRWGAGDTVCVDGTPARHPIDPVEAVYLSFWVRHSEGWQGSGRAYHPHLFHFITDQDSDYVGPARSRLTTYIEHVDGRALLALQDSLNVDLACVLRNDDSFVGCGGNFATYPFTEMRSVAACNGLAGDVDGRDCFPTGGGNWYSARYWRSAERVFTDAPGPGYESDWHHVEAFFAMNGFEDGAGVPDGAIRYWFDGRLVISSDRVLLRTAQHTSMRFDQLAMLPYIGDGSPIEQTMFIDEIVVAEGVRP